MMKRIIYLFFSVFVLFFIQNYFSLISETYAQCSGTATCGSRIVRVCRDTSTGNTCSDDTVPGCVCNMQCGGITTTRSCSFFPSCSASYCETLIGVCTRSSSCNYTPPPPPDDNQDPGGTLPPGTWGSCGSCNCGHGSECRTDPDGLCVWDPGGCGGGGGGSPFDCTIQSIQQDASLSSGPIYPGTPFRVRANVDVEPVECERTSATCLKQLTARSINRGIMDYSGVRDTSGIDDQEDRTFPAINPIGYARSVGSFTVRVEGTGQRCPTCDTNTCRAERIFNVVAPPPNFPTINITTPSDGGTVPVGVPFLIEADATDSDGTVVKVDFYMGSNANSVGTDDTPPSPFSVISSRAINNPSVQRTVFAKATDNDGNVTWDAIKVTTTANRVPTVTINYPAPNQQIVVGEVVPITTIVDDPDGDPITEVEFQVDGAPFPPASTDTSGPPWSANWTCTSPTPHTIRARATDNKGGVGDWTYVTVNGIAPGPWFQLDGGSIISGGSITSSIPTTVSDFFLNNPPSFTPGVAIYNGLLNIGTAPLSATGWQTNTATAPMSTYSYTHFSGLASGKIPPPNEFSDGATLSTNDFSSAVADGGYAWIRVNGDASFGNIGAPATVNVNQRVIVFVNGDLTINDRANLNAGVGNNFLMFIVRDDIIVNPALSSTGLNDPALHGIFFAGGTFNSGTNGTDDNLLVVRGSVAANSMNLVRDLKVENSILPAEVFQFSPELVANYPPALSVKHLIWREVAP